MVQNKIKKYKRKPKIASHVIDNTIYLLDEKNDELVILNESILYPIIQTTGQDMF